MKKFILQNFFGAIILFFCTSFFSCTKCDVKNSRKVLGAQSQFFLNTICSVNLYENGTPKLYEEIFKIISDTEKKFSAHIDTSYVFQINKNAGISAVAVPSDVLFVVETAKNFAATTDGMFDPTIGPLVNLWGINTENAHVPAKTEIAKTLKLVNWKNIEIKTEDSQIFLKEKNMALDLGGIAKGFAADEIVKFLKEKNISKAIIDLGGNIFAHGKKSDTALWKIGVKNPFDTTSAPEIILQIENAAVVTSGVYERFFIENEKRYHHILDTRTGFPAETNLVSVTIVCDDSMKADALSTSVFLLGKEKSKKLLEQFDADAIFIYDDNNIFATKNLENIISTAENFSGTIEFF